MYILKQAFFIIFFLALAIAAVAQTENLPINNTILQDSLSGFSKDSISVIDTINSDSSQVVKDKAAKKAPKGDIATTIRYTAKDSIYFDVANQVVEMYGAATITYGQIKLEADDIDIDWKSNMLMAEGKVDENGKKQGSPIFTDGPEQYHTDKIKYNFKTKKAFISGIVTQHGEGYVHGDQVKRNEKEEMFLNHAKYTTCNLETPHFHIEANKLKMIPNDKIISGPFHLKVNDIPTPLGFAFGMFPSPRKRTSGIIVPAYGEERLRGFFLRNGGFYLDINEYINLAVLGEIYSRGSHGVNIASDYRKRYAYNGRLNFSYNQFNSGALEDTTGGVKNFWLQWSHSPQSRGTSRFSASVNAGTSTFNQYNFVNNMQQQLNTTFNSNVSYSKTFTGTPFNLTSSLRHNQNVRTGQMDLTLPDIAINMNRIYPFKFAGSSGKRWYEKINLAYNFNASNRLTNNGLYVDKTPGVDTGTPGGMVGGVNQGIGGATPAGRELMPFNMQNLPTIFDNAQVGGRHTIPVSTSMTALKYFTVSPAFNYEEVWYLKQLNHQFNPQLGTVVTDTTSGFYRAYSYSASASVNTRIYGTYYPNSKNIKGIRHVMTPSMSLSYRPDFSRPQYDYYQYVQSDTNGNFRYRSRYEGFLFGTPGMGRSAALSFSLNNNIEMKVRDKKDSTNEKATKKISIFDNISMSTGYDIIADSFNLAPIRIAARTRLFDNKVDINLGGTIDPYIYEMEGEARTPQGGRTIRQRRIDEYAWNHGQGIGQISNLNFAVGTSFNPQARKGDKKTPKGGNADEMEYINANPDMYVDWSVPWNLRVNYSLFYTRVGHNDPSITQSINFSGDVSITEKWKITFNSGFDVQRKEFTMTNINIHRDLHCWELLFNWVPFGRLTSYSLDVRVKSSILQDLKLSRRRSFFDMGF